MTPQFFTPLRYPGGKGKLAEYVKAIIRENDLVGGVYAEPYAGGAAVAFELLLLDYADEIYINDLNRSVYSFWHEVLTSSDRLIERIERTPVTIEEWNIQKSVQRDSSATLSDLAFSTFFLNRCNRSGIIKAGVIGGKEQLGKWKIDARFNKPELIQRIQQIARFKDRITLHNLDAVMFVRDVGNRLPAKTLLYLDPPYYVKGEGLYDSFYQHADHEAVSQAVRAISDQKWIVSYDDVPQISELYSWSRSLHYRLSYSAQSREQGGEVMFFCESLTIPEIPRKVPMYCAA